MRNHVILFVQGRSEIVQVSDVVRHRELRTELFHEEFLRRDVLPGKIQLPVRHLLANPQAAIGLQLSAHLVRRLTLPVIRQLRRAEGELQIGRLFEENFLPAAAVDNFP